MGEKLESSRIAAVGFKILRDGPRVELTEKPGQERLDDRQDIVAHSDFVTTLGVIDGYSRGGVVRGITSLPCYGKVVGGIRFD